MACLELFGFPYVVWVVLILILHPLKSPRIIKLIAALLLFLVHPIRGYNQVCTSIASGSWVSSFTWSCRGTNATPTCGDTVYVDAAHVVTVNNQVDLTACGSSIVVDITGDLAFTNGNKLELPCGSLVSLQTDGRVYKTTPGGGHLP